MRRMNHGRQRFNAAAATMQEMTTAALRRCGFTQARMRRSVDTSTGGRSFGFRRVLCTHGLYPHITPRFTKTNRARRLLMVWEGTRRGSVYDGSGDEVGQQPIAGKRVVTAVVDVYRRALVVEDVQCVQ